MKIQKRKKGEIGYLAYKKKVVLFQTLLMFGISVLIFICGYLYKGTKENIMTIVAVLGLLPASKSLVSLIMYLKTPKYDISNIEKLMIKCENTKPIAELYFTSYKKSFPCNAMLCSKDTIIGYSAFANVKEQELEAHIKDILNQNSYKDITVKIFKDYDKFEQRALQLSCQKPSESLTQLMLDISL